MNARLRAIILLGGMAAGFVGATIAGWVASDAAMPDFVRLHKYIGAETLYLPTAPQLAAIVREQCPADRTLVLIAGDSVFNGFGQRPERIWTARLEELLGGRYCVVNLATALSSIGDIGAVMLDVLRPHYPRVILVANTVPGTCGGPTGSRAYGYLFWDAYWKGLIGTPEERRRVVDTWAPIGEPLAHRDQEIRLGMWLDATLRFNELWTFVTARWVSTVWTFDTRERFPAPRQAYADPVPTILPVAERFPPARQRRGALAIAAYSGPFFDREADGTWTERTARWDQLEREINAVLPAAHRPQTLIIMTEVNPVYRDSLPPDEQDRHARLYRGAVSRWRQAGYRAEVLARNFTPEDYLDHNHFTEAGGDKLAAAIAPLVRQIAGDGT